MAMEPISVFSRIVGPAKVAQLLRELVPGVKIDGPDERWENAVVTFGSWWKKRTLTLTHDPEYYAEPNWSNQMSGMRGYFGRFPETDAKRRVMMLTTTFKFSLGTIFEPDFDSDDDPRLDILYAVTEALDGVLFTPSSLRDAHGRILFSACDDEDPEAEWPKVVAEVKIEDDDSDDQAGETEPPNPPSVERVIQRAMALAAVTTRAMLERDADAPNAPETYQRLLEWVDEIDIGEEIEPDEWAVLQRPLGKLDEQSQINSIWRIEGLVVLAWALGRFEMPPHDELVAVNPLWDSLGVFEADTAKTLIADAKLRAREEIETLRNQLFAIHWRMRNFHLNPGVLDFVEFAGKCWFGKMDIRGLPLVDNDIALQGQRIDQAEHDLFSRTHSAALERHLAINWLCDGPDRYSEASVAT